MKSTDSLRAKTSRFYSQVQVHENYVGVKASKKINRNDFKGLKYLKEEGVFNNLILVSRDPVSSLTDGVLTLPWQKFLSDLWRDKFV